MKILRLEAENIKKLKCVEITPDGNVVEITGKNGAGKSSVLDSIWWALAGAGNIQAVPIRQGETEGHITLDLGELIVTRKFKVRDDEEITTSVVVSTADGARFPSPQKVLDGLLGALSFDPLAFTRMSAAEQFDALKHFVPDVDFAAIAAANKVDYDRRTEFNREAKQQSTLAAAIMVPPDALTDFVDERPILNGLKQAGEINVAIEREKTNRAQRLFDLDNSRSALRQLLERMQKLEAELELMDQEAQKLNAEIVRQDTNYQALPPISPLVDTAKLTADLQAVQTMNRTVELVRTRISHQMAADRALSEAMACSAHIRSRCDSVLSAVAAAKLPVPGISFGEGEVLLNGVPFSQASTAEQLRTSIAIAMANNPKLRVIRVRDGSVLDAEGMKALADAAQQNDFQVWIEVVESERPTAIHIEDGSVVS